MAIFHCLRFETPPTWRARSPYLYPPGRGWPSYTPRHWVPFPSPFKTRKATVDVFGPASTREARLNQSSLPGSFCRLRVTMENVCCLRVSMENVRCLRWHGKRAPYWVGLHESASPQKRVLASGCPAMDYSGFQASRHSMYIMTPKPISMAYFVYPSNRFVCMSVPYRY
jgi:hypothetical protein